MPASTGVTRSSSALLRRGRPDEVVQVLPLDLRQPERAGDRVEQDLRTLRLDLLLIPGTSSIAHLEENLAVDAIKLDEDDLATLDRTTPIAAPAF